MKAAAGGTPELGPTLSAFATMPQGGTIILGLDEAAGFTSVDRVSKNTLSYLTHDARGHGFDRPELPLRAVREIIANPCGLWGISADQLGHQGGKSAVNLALYDLCKLVRMEDGSRVIEGEGGGIRDGFWLS